jgi:hypothetical protein
MEDYEVRLVMNRASATNVSVRFENRMSKSISESFYYVLHPIVKNRGIQVVNNIKLVFLSPGRFLAGAQMLGHNPHAICSADSDRNYAVGFQTSMPLLPEDERDLCPEMEWEYWVSQEHLNFLRKREVPDSDTTVVYKLFADNMIPKSGTFSYYDFTY